MGLVLSVIIVYAGFNEALESLKHIISGIIPDTEPNFQDLVEYYTKLLRKTANPSSPRDWTTECGQGYLCLTEDKDGCIKSATVKFYGDKTHSTALLFSTKISSFGQDSLDEQIRANGDSKFERYQPTKTKTIISESSGSFSVQNKNRSPTTSETILDVNDIPDNSREKDYHDLGEENKDKLTWGYIPKSPSPAPLPEINFQSYDDDKTGDVNLSEKYLRSLDGIKYRPLQRNDPSGRRRTFRKRNSSSSNSSKESRASREEELKMFTSLEEAEFKSMSRENNYTGFGSAPNLAARSYSRSRSRERSNEKKYNSVDETPETRSNEKLEVTHQRSLPRLGSFEEKDELKETVEANEVNEESEDIDFWSNIAD